MERPLSVLVPLVLLLIRRGTTTDVCHDKICPQYKVIETNQDFEVRLYDATNWITATIEGKGLNDLKAAHSKLEDYCNGLRRAGYEIPSNAWPVLISSTEGSGLSLSWFIPPGTRMPEDTHPLVKQQSRAEGTVYVRVFREFPSFESVEKYTDVLHAALDKAGKDYDRRMFSGAFYESYFSTVHNNEVFISAAP
ncbi:hypothetical protein Q5P01_008465 [Channa striata]|uniref:Heme-binding protein 2 n=1 Tax=Channa striata TaxID=64152 RepID=A0AA88MZF2_CHASR|nr:hypothetical protein Q5P01_008465 [Channa striata]